MHTRTPWAGTSRFLAAIETLGTLQRRIAFEEQYKVRGTKTSHGTVTHLVKLQSRDVRHVIRKNAEKVQELRPEKVTLTRDLLPSQDPFTWLTNPVAFPSGDLAARHKRGQLDNLRKDFAGVSPAFGHGFRASTPRPPKECVGLRWKVRPKMIRRSRRRGARMRAT
eukprot:384530-Rhodomonas_salina.1